MRARLTVLAVLVVNALVQALLVLPDPTPTASPLFILGALVSAAAWLATGAVVVARQVDPGPMLITVRRGGARFAVWTLALAVLVFLALIPFNGVLGFLLLAVTPYVPIAAMAGAPNPLAADLHAIRRRPLGLVWRVVVLGVLVLLVLLAMALTAFFVGGAAAAFANCLVLGLVGWLVTWSFAREYRRAT